MLNLRGDFISNHSNCVAIVSVTFDEDMEESTKNQKTNKPDKKYQNNKSHNPTKSH